MPERRVPRVVAAVRSPWFATAFVAACLAAVLLPHHPADLDLWARLAVGRLVEATGDVPRVDPFAFTPRKPEWIDHEWLSGVVFDRTARAFGGAGLTGLKLLLIAGTVLLLVAARVGRPGARVRLAVLLPVSIAAADAWLNTVRSHVFTLLLVAAFSWLLVRHERTGGARWLAPLVPLTWLWAHLHGGVLVGLGILGVTAAWAVARDRSRRGPLVAVAILAAASLFVGPYGPSYVRFLADAVTMSRPGIREWEPLSLASEEAVVPLLAAGLVVVGALVDRDARRAAGPGLVVLACAAFFAARHQRHVPIFLVLAYVHGADLIAAPFVRVARAFRLPTRTIVTAAAGAAAAAAPVLLVLAGGAWTRSATPDTSWYPVDACRWLRREGPGGRLLCGFNEGSFALWRLHPRYLVSLDGRYEEVYPESTKALVTDALDPTSPRHADALAAVAPDAILLRRDVREGNFGAGWVVAYRDERFDVLLPAPRGAAPAGPGDVDGTPASLWLPPAD
ncbi:MAG: hypothetical protein ACF8XB_24055 [Planctomycetota bacterium JB042]